MPTITSQPSPNHVRRAVTDRAGSPVPPALRVRRAAASDLDALVELEQRSFSSDRLSRAQYRRHLDSDSALVLVAGAGARHVLGSAVLFFRKGSTVARLYSLATLPEARGQGVGAALLVAALQAARRRRCDALRLEVRTDNAAAIALYAQQGFQRIGVYTRYYQDGADAWRYEKPLA